MCLWRFGVGKILDVSFIPLKLGCAADLACSRGLYDISIHSHNVSHCGRVALLGYRLVSASFTCYTGCLIVGAILKLID